MSSEIEVFKNQILGILQANKELAYSVSELAEMLHTEKWKIQRAVSQLQDEGRVGLRVSKKVVYAYFREERKLPAWCRKCGQQIDSQIANEGLCNECFASRKETGLKSST